MREILRKHASSAILNPEGFCIGLIIGEQQIYFERTFQHPCTINKRQTYIEVNGYSFRAKNIIDVVDFSKEPQLVKLLQQLN